ncbi:MAG: HipA domain-containing protein [Tessaracoccus sp.]|uniref:type II toxin-antitoxin system HipA family toxin n=1 Tax=Tessaracoccus sp. TaxID=1971211 RepID=UPI001EBE0971|nr:HipA domain-containing protein [Tessaracoccus sp.]MBK7821417.1 HipA domain-containing protein [Tessaracoccus sp.]
MADLLVELYDTVVGRIAGDWRSFDFSPEPEALRRFGLDSSVLSVAVPLVPVSTRSRRAQRQAFFANLLPEGQALMRLAARVGVEQHDVVGFLRHYGRDVAGALQIWDPDVVGEPRTPRRVSLDETGIAALLLDAQGSPLGNRPFGGKTSLAGVQEKIVLAWDGAWAQVVDGYPSTHILKPEVPSLRSMIYDEEYGARFVRALGLASFDTALSIFDGVPALVVERFDRTTTVASGLKTPGRVHVEDFAQALGLTGNQKYQRYGGRVTLGRVADVLRQHDPSSLAALSRTVVAAVATGNLDLHAKNLGLLHPEAGSVSLAPAYDWVPMAHQSTDGELAMAVGREYRHAPLTTEHLVRELRGWGVSGAGSLVSETLETILEVARREAPAEGAHLGLQSDIVTFAERLLRGDPVGRAISVAG